MEGVYEGISLDVLVLAVLEMDSFGPSRTGRTWSSWSSLHKQKAELWRGEGARTATPPRPRSPGWTLALSPPAASPPPLSSAAQLGRHVPPAPHRVVVSVQKLKMLKC